MHRDAFCEEVAAVKFNDGTTIFHVDFSGAVAGVRASGNNSAPRTGPEMKKQYGDDRG